MRKLSLALLLGLAACAAPMPGPSFRPHGGGIYSTAGLDPARIMGRWHEVAGFYDPAREGCATGLTDVSAGSGGTLRFSIGACAGIGARTVSALPGDAAGRYRPALPGRLGETWWVLWVGSDNDAMVIGTPSGRFGAILSRTPTLRPDLYEAARQVLDFNGYDLTRLKPAAR